MLSECYALAVWHRHWRSWVARAGVIWRRAGMLSECYALAVFATGARGVLLLLLLACGYGCCRCGHAAAYALDIVTKYCCSI